MYFLAIIQKSEGETTQAIYRYLTFDEAYCAFHYELQYRGGGREKTTCLILDEDGQVLRSETWNAD